MLFMSLWRDNVVCQCRIHKGIRTAATVLSQSQSECGQGCSLLFHFVVGLCSSLSSHSASNFMVCFVLQVPLDTRVDVRHVSPLYIVTVYCCVTL